MNKKVNRLAKGLGFFSIVIGVVFVGLVYGLKKDLMIAEIGKLFDYAIDFMFHREWVGRVLTANLMIIGSLVVAIAWMILCIKKKRIFNGVFGSFGVLGGVTALLMMYKYRKSLIFNADNSPILGNAIIIMLVLFLLLMALNIIVSFLNVVLSTNEEDKCNSTLTKKLDNIAGLLFALLATLIAVGCFIAVAFRFNGVMNRAPKFYHFVLDLFNIAKWDATNITTNFSAFAVLLCVAFWFVYNITKERSQVGPLSLVITCGMLVALVNYKDTFAFYLEHDSVNLSIVVYVFYILLVLATITTIIALSADCLAASESVKKVDVINIRVTGDIQLAQLVEKEDNLEDLENVEVAQETQEVIETPVAEPASKIEEAIAEEVSDVEEVSEEAQTFELGGDLIEVVDENNKKLIINKRLYTNKLCLANDDLKHNYNVIKNAILKYSKVRSRISSNYESFRRGRKLLVRFNVLGKTLRVYLALDPNEYPITVYHQRNEGSKNKYQLVPMMLRVRSPRSVRNAVRLIDELMEKEGLKLVKNFVEVDYAKEFKYDSNALLIKDGYKKLVRDEIDEAHADELSDAEAMKVVVNKEIEEVIEPQQKVVATNAKINKSIVNVDQINQVFEYDEYVTLEKLKEKGLVNKKTNYIKVLSRGVINKPMTIEANEFSLKAVKMIVLTGGSVVKLVSK